jgi:hypothetical protein
MAMHGGAWRPGDSYFPIPAAGVASTPAPVGLPRQASIPTGVSFAGGGGGGGGGG